MKMVTRKLPVYQYKFGTYNSEDGTITHELTYETTELLSDRKLERLKAEHGILLMRDEKLVNAKLPADLFMELDGFMNDDSAGSVTVVKDPSLPMGYRIMNVSRETTENGTNETNDN